jgi:hypothetical protein
MKKLFFPAILLCSVIGFALRPAPYKLVIYLPPLASFPTHFGDFHTVSDNDKVLLQNPETDGSVGLERTYMNAAGTAVDVYIAPQMLGQHVPAECYNYAGASILSVSQLTLPGAPSFPADRMSLQDGVDDTRNTCLYYWKTATGSVAPDPNHAIRELASSWNHREPGILVRVCMKTPADNPQTDEILAALARGSYSPAGSLYSAVFPDTTK